jgi:LacI family transcriptional regulator
MVGINQQFIAEQLNISRTTVSRCFTNHPGINPDTRAKVFALASQMGYHYMEPKVRAKGPKNVSASIGVVVCSDVEEFNRPDYQSPGMELIPGVSEFAQLQQVQMDLHFVSPVERSIEAPSYQRIFGSRRRKWRGVILIYPFPSAVLDELVTRYPCVSLVEQYSHTSLDCVDVDHHKGVALMMSKLLQLGHRRVGFVSRKYAVEALWSYRRQSAYFEMVQREKLGYRDADTIFVEDKPDGGERDSYRQIIERVEDGVTAFVCAADHQAYDLIHQLQLAGYRVPQDVSVTGFDGIRRPPGMPLLTTMRIPYREIGLTGGRRLFELAGKRYDSPQHILLECNLEPGETIAPPRAVTAKKSGKKVA